MEYAWIALFILTFLDHACTTCFVFANVLETLFQSHLQIVKGIWKDFEKHFQDLKFSPPVSNAFPLTKQNSPSTKFSS
jgi:hypothetical protein